MSAKNQLIMDADIKRAGEEEVKNLVDVFHGWSKLQTQLKDRMSCYIIYRLIMPSEKVSLIYTTSVTLLYCHQYQR